MSGGSGQAACFTNVAVSVPTGPLCSGPGEVQFVPLTIGKVEVDAIKDVFLVFEGSTSVAPKLLGHLVRASAIVGDQLGCTLDVRTEGSAQGAALHRFLFKSQRDALRFCGLAEFAEQEECAVWRQGENERAVRTTELEDAVKRKLADRQPLVFSGAQLYGPDECGEVGSEVLLGDGAFVLLDPQADGSAHVGTYELLFFCEEDGAESPVKKLTIGPKMVLRRLDREKAEIDDDEAPTISFELILKGESVTYTLTFDSVMRGADFERDLRVRQRLMDLALLTSKKLHSAEEARQQLDRLKHSSSIVQLWRRMQLVLSLPTLLLLALAIHPGTRGVASAACSWLCHVLGACALDRSPYEAVPMESLRRCFALGGVTYVNDCVEQLLQSS